MRSGIDLTSEMEFLGHEGFTILRVDERGYVLDVEYDTGLELTIREPRSFNEKKIWNSIIQEALEMHFQMKEEDRAI